MTIIDLHQDRSDNSLCTTHKDFLTKEENQVTRNAEQINGANQVDLYKLKNSKVSAVITSLFIEPATMKAGDNIFSRDQSPIEAAKYELYRHNKFYNDLIERSQGELVSILNKQDLDKTLNSGKIGIIKHIEGFYFLRDKESEYEKLLDEIYSMGVRSIGLTRNINNILSEGSNSLKEGYGLTNLGRSFIKNMEKRGIILDLAHMSRKSVDNALEIIEKPVMVSHTALTSYPKKERFLTVEQGKKVAEKGGIIGLMGMINNNTKYPLKNLSGYVKQMKEMIKIFGENHVSIGSDFDGLEKQHVIKNFENANKYDNLINELQKQGVKSSVREKVLFKNAKNFLFQMLK